MQSVSYMGDGSTTEFTFNFPYYENTNIIVTLNNTTATGYNIIGTSGGLDADIPYTGGKIVFDTAPTALDSIKISRSLPLSRVVDYQPTAKLDPTTLNQDMNYMMEVLKDIKDEFDDLSTKYAEIADKESTATLLARIDEIDGEIGDVNQTITDFNTEIENGRIMSKDDFYSYTTNCITEIPQDIKLELNNGVLTLKTGSKVYNPDGTYIQTTTDKSVSFNSNGQRFVYMNESGYLSVGAALSGTSSGTTDGLSGMAWHYWFDTANNVINGYSADGTTISHTFSLPIAIVTVSNGAISSIDQVFNGFGYIGSTIFALPGIEFIVPNGLNDNGTLNNTLWTTTSVITYTQTSGSDTLDIVINTTNNSFDLANYTYNSNNNYNYTNGAISNNSVIVGSVTFTSGAITSATLKKVLSLKLN